MARQQDDWTEEDFDSLKNVLSSWISEDEDRAPASLRFAFHTCVGGCDGCINMEDDLNLGLDEVYEPINELYSEIFPFSEKQLELSRADFWALAGIVGVEYTIGLNNQVCEGDPVCVMKEVQLLNMKLLHSNLSKKKFCISLLAKFPIHLRKGGLPDLPRPAIGRHCWHPGRILRLRYGIMVVHQRRGG